MTAESTNPARIGRPTRSGAKAGRTRRRILDAAAGLLAQRGLSGVTLSEIARTAGLKAGSVYFHFDSKDAVLDEVLALGVEQSLSYLRDALAGAGPRPADRLAAGIRAHLEACTELSDYAAVVLAVDDTALGADHADYRRGKHEYTQSWLELIQDAQRTGAIAAGDPRLVRRLLFAAMNCQVPARSSSAEVGDVLLALFGIRT